jgi:hypothetical protein
VRNGWDQWNSILRISRFHDSEITPGTLEYNLSLQEALWNFCWPTPPSIWNSDAPRWRQIWQVIKKLDVIAPALIFPVVVARSAKLWVYLQLSIKFGPKPAGFSGADQNHWHPNHLRLLPYKKREPAPQGIESTIGEIDRANSRMLARFQERERLDLRYRLNRNEHDGTTRVS